MKGSDSMARFDIAGQDKSVETDVLIVEDNIIRWSNTMIQISNISLISTVKTRGKMFPFLSLLLLGVGIYMLNDYNSLGWVFLIAAGAWIAYWAIQNDKESNKAILSISLNSGITYNILFNDKKFLSQVLKQLATLISKPFSSRSLTINVKDSTFGENSSVVRNMNS